MKRIIGFGFVAAAIGCAAFAQAGSGSSFKQDVVRPKIEQPAPAAYPILPFQTLRPVF